MKDYIKSKLKKSKKYSIVGHGDEEEKRQRARQNELQGNADAITDTLSQLSPPFSADLLIGSAKLESLELLSDGPIQGYFNEAGESCSLLEATYLNDIPIVDKVSKRVRYKDLKLDNLKACQVDYTTGVKRYLMDHRAYISTGIGVSGRRHPIPSPFEMLNGPSPLESDLAKRRRHPAIEYKTTINKALNEDAGGPFALYFACNPGRTTGEARTTDIGKSAPTGFNYGSGGGYRRAIYGSQAFYGQDQISRLRSFVVPSSNYYSVFRPLKYQGAMSYGNGLNSANGNISTSFCTRSFVNVLQGFYDETPFSLFQTGYAEQALFFADRWDTSESVGVRVPGDSPYAPTIFGGSIGWDEPDGLLEPHLSGIYALIDQLPNQKEAKGYIFKQKQEHDLSRFDGWLITGNNLSASDISSNSEFNASDNILEVRGFAYDTDDHDGSYSIIDFFNTNQRNKRTDAEVDSDGPRKRKHNAGYYEVPYNARTDTTGVLGIAPQENYRITGSYYVSGGAHVSGLRFFTIKDVENHATTANFGPNRTTVATLDARSNMNQWVNFDISYTQTSNDVPGCFSLGFVTYGADKPNSDNNIERWSKKDRVFFKNLTIARQDYLNSLPDYASLENYAYFVFPIDKYRFAEDNDEDSKINPNFKLTASVGSGAPIYTDEENILKYVMKDVDGFSGVSRNIRESIAYEMDIDPAGGDDFAQYKLFNITGNSVGYPHNIEIKENRAQRFKGSVLWPVYLGENQVALSGLNEESRLDSLKRVMLFPSDDHGVKQAKYNSGVIHGYDVFSGLENGGICYSHIANPNPPVQNDSFVTSTGDNFPIQIRLEEIEPESYNYPNVSFDTVLGEEVQRPLVNDSKAEIVISRQLLGPFNVEENTNAPTGVYATGLTDAGFFAHMANSVYTTGARYESDVPYRFKRIAQEPRQVGKDDFVYDTFHVVKDAPIYTGSVSLPSLGSHDVRITGVAGKTETDLNEWNSSNQSLLDFGNWNSNAFIPRDEIGVTHLITRSEVDRVQAIFNIRSLYSKHQFDDDPTGPRVGYDKLPVNLEITVGFDGVDSDIFTPASKRISFEGIVEQVYSASSEIILLPKYEDILDSFPNDTIQSLQQKHKRFVTVQKLDFETISTNISRDIDIYSIIEYVNCNFTYPNSALVRTQLDARNFNDLPKRTYNAKLKKILVPSNYEPLFNNGVDKRFYAKASDYNNDAVIYDGDWDGSFKLAWSDNPAWILYDLMTNTRYGIGNFIDEKEDINIFNLYKIGRYCDAVDNNGVFVGLPDGLGGLEPRYSANILINQADNAYEVLTQICSIFNGNPFWSNGALDFYSDKPTEPTAFFNNGNVFDGIFNYQDVNKASNFNCVAVEFQDKNDSYKIKTEVVEDEDGIRKDGKLMRSMNARGSTSRGQARRLAKYVLYSNKLEREIVEFQSSLESLLVNVGDIIEISDELRKFEVDHAKVLGTSRAPNQLGAFRYYRFLGTNSDDSAAATRQAIAEIHLIDDGGTTFPTSDFGSSPSPDGGGNDVTGPFTNGGITVSAGYSHSNTYAPHNAFDGGEGPFIWWTLGITDASLNYLDVDFGSAKSISQIQVSVNKDHHHCPKLRILASNSADFSSFEVFGEIDYQSESNITDLNGDTLTVDVDDIITVGASKSTSTTSIGRGSVDSVVIENTIDINNIGSNSFVYAPSGQTGKDEMYDEIRKGGFVTNARLSGMDAEQTQRFSISSAVASGDNAIKLNFTNTSGQAMDLIRTGSFVNIDLENQDSQKYRVIKVVPQEDNLYSITATEYVSGKFNFIEADDEKFNLTQETPYNIGIVENPTKEITQPVSFSTSQSSNHMGTNTLTVTINGDTSGNEEIYLISVVLPNGIRKQKKIQKSDNTSGGFIVTEAKFKNLDLYGTYNVFVESVR